MRASTKEPLHATRVLHANRGSAPNPVRYPLVRYSVEHLISRHTSYLLVRRMGEVHCLKHWAASTNGTDGCLGKALVTQRQCQLFIRRVWCALAWLLGIWDLPTRSGVAAIGGNATLYNWWTKQDSRTWNLGDRFASTLGHSTVSKVRAVKLLNQSSDTRPREEEW